MKEEIKPQNIYGGGPYSPAIRLCDVIYISGQFGVDANGKPVGGLKEQTEQALENIEKILKEKNLTMDNIVKVTIFLVSSENIEEKLKIVNDAYENYFKNFKKPYPARSTVIVAGLPIRGALIEIEAIAYVF
ncbi:MAG: RidA family protein, partial [Candidatus Hydrothermales bacterium]